MKKRNDTTTISNIFSSYKEIFNKNKIFILALSGGPDSVFLGEKLLKYFSAKNIIVAHFNHNIRKDSKNDEAFCKQWAKEKGCVFESAEWKEPIDSEEKARNARYTFLEKIRKKYNAAGIFVGTHSDDNVETILFQFLRGSGAKGLSGIKKREEKRKIFRPLLGLSKKEIVDFLKEKNIPYCLDSTNIESKYSRNFLRNKVIPLLNKKFPFWQKNIVRQAEIFEEIDDFLNKKAEKFLTASQKKNDGFFRSDFSAFHPALQNYVLRNIFTPIALDFDQVKRLREFIKEGISGKKIQLKGKEILLSHDFFFVEDI